MSNFVEWVTHGIKRGRFETRSRAAVRLFAAFATLTLIAVLYLMLVSWIAAKGRRVEDLQAELCRLERENERLEVLIAEEGTVSRLMERATALGFVPTERAEFLPVEGLGSR